MLSVESLSLDRLTGGVLNRTKIQLWPERMSRASQVWHDITTKGGEALPIPPKRMHLVTHNPLSLHFGFAVHVVFEPTLASSVLPRRSSCTLETDKPQVIVWNTLPLPKTLPPVPSDTSRSQLRLSKHETVVYAEHVALCGRGDVGGHG
jgi:hypothetical protein